MVSDLKALDPGRGVSRPVTAKEEAFCRLLASGVAPGVAWVTVYRPRKSVTAAVRDREGITLSNRRAVRDRLSVLTKSDDKRAFLTRARKREILWEMAEDVKLKPSSRQAAIDLDNKMSGEYVNRVAITADVTLTAVMGALGDAPALPDAGEILQLGASALDGFRPGDDVTDIEVTPGRELEGVAQAILGVPGPFEDEGVYSPPVPVIVREMPRKRGRPRKLPRPSVRVYAD